MQVGMTQCIHAVYSTDPVIMHHSHVLCMITAFWCCIKHIKATNSKLKHAIISLTIYKIAKLLYK